MLEISAQHVHRPERTSVEITDPTDMEEYLEDSYGIALRLRRLHTDRHEGAVLSHSRTDVGPFAMEEVGAAGGLAAAPDPLHKVCAVWASGGRAEARCDGKGGEAASGGITLLSQPDLPYRVHTEDIHATLLLLNPSVVSGVAAGLPSEQAPLPIRFTSFTPVDANAARQWKDTVRYVKESVLADDALATPLVLGSVSRLLAAVTLATFPNTSVVAFSPTDRTDHNPVLLRRAMQYMDANARNDIAMADVAAAVHVTPRAVQYMFRRHLETTPLQYLRRLRLHYAHQDLLSGDKHHDTVTDIAARWGFAHTGRFAVVYRRTYGQSPHTTLRG